MTPILLHLSICMFISLQSLNCRVLVFIVAIATKLVTEYIHMLGIQHDNNNIQIN